jgi:hypothetical protein
LFQLDGDDVELGLADIFECVRPEGRRPEGSASDDWRNGPAVEDDRAIFTATHEVTDFENVERCRPTVGMEGSDFSWRNAGVEDADYVILEKQAVV